MLDNVSQLCKYKNEDRVAPEKVDIRTTLLHSSAYGLTVNGDSVMHPNIKDMAGLTVGNIKVIRYTGSNRHRQAMWLVKCLLCKKEYTMCGTQLTRGVYACDGCNHGGKLSRKPEVWRASFLSVIGSYKGHARERSVEWSLTKDECLKFFKSDCFYCGIEPKRIRHHKRGGYFIYTGIDRIDSRLGYTLDNVVPSCFDCNRSKGALSLDEWREWLERVYEKTTATKLPGSV